MLEIFLAEFAVDIPIQCRRQDGALLLIHLPLFPLYRGWREIPTAWCCSKHFEVEDFLKVFRGAVVAVERRWVLWALKG